MGQAAMSSDWPVLMRCYRKENGLKQEAMAYQLSVDQTTISRWERGIDSPSLAMQKRLRDLFWKREDSALDAAVRMVRASPGRAAILVPGTKIIEVSDSQADHYGAVAHEMKGKLMRHYYGNEYYERYMQPLGEIGIYNGEISRIDLISKITLRDGSHGYSHSSIVPLLCASGIYAVSQSQHVSEAFAQSRPDRQIYRFDELLD